MKILEISKKQIKQDYDTMLVKEILSKYGICWSRFYRILDDFGIERKRKPTKPRRGVKVIYKE